MAKNTFQDVVPGKRSIRDISLPPRRASNISPSPDQNTTVRNTTRDIKVKKTPSKDPEEDVQDQDTVPPVRSSSYTFDYDDDTSSHGQRRWGLWVLALVFILAVALGVSSLFASAKVLVTPKSQTLPINISMTASLNQPATVFGYQVVSVSASNQEEVNAGAVQNVNAKSTGTVMIYNTSATAQNLIATTRLETTASLVYRLTSAVTVPAEKVVGGKSVPGSVSASVVADQPGDTYNIPLSDFTLPGLKGTAKYAQVYGRSVTPMTGGGSGQQKTVDATTSQSASTNLQNALKNVLETQLTSQIPANFILYPASISYSFATVSQTADATPGKAMLTLSGAASAVIFDKALLSQAILANIASSTTLSTQGAANVTNLSTLTFTLKQPTVLTKSYTGSISFQISGDAHIVWMFDQAGLKNDLIGLKKDNLLPLLQAKYPTIDSASAKIFPIWKGSFPSNPDKIVITQTQ